jgi:hypothetical protein
MTHAEDPFGVTLVYGAPGMGKTTLIVSALIEYAHHGTTLVLDLTGDIRSALALRAPETQRIVSVSSPQGYAKAKPKPGLFDTKSVGWQRGTHVIITLGERPIHEVIALWKGLATDKNHRCQFVAAVCDESEQLFGTTNAISPELRESVLVARNEHRAMIFATKRPTAVSTYFRSTARRACVFKVLSDADARACDELGPSKLFRADGRGVQYLPQGKYLYFSGSEHTPDSTLPVMDSRSPVPWLSHAKRYYKRSR